MTAEVVVVGAGPAGIAAAVRARESGARVLVLDENPSPGGQIWRGGQGAVHGHQQARWLSRWRAAGVSALPGGRVVAADLAARTLLVETHDRAREVAFQKLILTTGAREIFLPFPGWTLPGVAGVGGLQALAKAGVPIARKRIVVAGSGPLLLASAAYFREHGASVKLIAEQAPPMALARFGAVLARSPVKLLQAAGLSAALLGVPYLAGCWVEAASGDGRVQRVRLRQGSRVWTEQCDYAAIGYGLYPNTELAASLGCELDGQAIAVDAFQGSTVDAVYAAGECTGIGGVELSIVEGEIAGYAAAGAASRARRLFGIRAEARRFAARLNAAFSLRDELRRLPEPETFVCRCEDVTFEGLHEFEEFRAAKLHTRCGMGPCQGRICGPAAEFLFGWRTQGVRPPIFPARVRSLLR